LEGSRLLENTGDGQFTDITSAWVEMNEVCWAGQWLDVDADGWEELHITTGIAAYVDYPSVLSQFDEEPDALFKNDAGELILPGGLFQSVTALGFATATGDFNGDGFVDLVSHKVGLNPEIRTALPNTNHWLRVLLHGVESNADAVGAKIEMWAGSSYWYRETYCGEAYLSQNSRWEHFGAANHTQIDSIRVEWPLGWVDTWYDVPTNTSIELTEFGATTDEASTGCTYAGACNYNAEANEDDGSCDFSCLLESLACGNGLVWNPVTTFCEPSCLGDSNGDSVVDVVDLLEFLSAFGQECN